jgi:hypothetical protein
MKASQLTLIAVFISIICLLNTSLVSALSQGEISVTPSWTSPTIGRGSITSVTIRLTSSSSDELTIYGVGIHFDWMESGTFFLLDLSDNPVVVPSQGLYVFQQMTIQVPANVSAGSHSYYIGLDGTQGSPATSFTWDSSNFALEISESSPSNYDTLREQVANALSEAETAGYQNAEAKSLLEQASDAYGQALILANQTKMDEAIAALQNASSLLDQAEVAEQQNGTPQNPGLQTLILFLVAGAVVAVVVGVTIALLVRRKDKAAESVVDDSVADDSGVDQPQET